MKYYYTNSSNQPVGPVERAELDQLAARGVIKPETSIVAEGSQAWGRYADLLRAEPANAAAAAIASGVSRASAALQTFSWGSMAFGLLLSLLSWLTLPSTVLTSAARELADWGRLRILPSASSDLPVLTFLVVILRNASLVISFTVCVICAVLSIFGVGPFYHGSLWTNSSWNAGYAFGGFVIGMLVAYFGQLAVALWFEMLSIGVRIANDVKRIAQR